MIKAILFDLDNTLLINPMSTFLPAYFKALGEYLSGIVAPGNLIKVLLSSTHSMQQNDGTGATNEETFSASFYPRLGVRREELEPILKRFYLEEYPTLRSLTRPGPGARDLMDWSFQQGFRVVIATNPLFPRIALEQRLAWANLAVTEFDYALVTTLENMHATKAHPAYYLEIARNLGLEPGQCMMVGDDWHRDMIPAVSVGMAAYWVREEEKSWPDEVSLSEPVHLLGRGTLREVRKTLITGVAPSA